MKKIKIHVTLMDDVLDPQGKTINKALDNLGYKGISDMRIGKYIEFNSEESDEKKLNQQVDNICKDVLSNQNIEKYEFFVESV